MQSSDDHFSKVKLVAGKTLSPTNTSLVLCIDALFDI